MIAADNPLRSHRSSSGSSAVLPLVPCPPGWVRAILGDEWFEPPTRARHVAVTTSGLLSLYATAVPMASSLTAAGLRTQVEQAYASIADALARERRQPIRFWNFLPSPGGSMGDSLDRYMVFNAGRYDAYARWYGTPRAFSHSLATASCVGVASDDYVLYCLASDKSGVPVENPRQTPSWQYSTRYGPKPPCFARATVADLNGTSRLLIGGTASILGEESVHVGDVHAQTDEALRNISALIATARRRPDEPSETSLSRMSDVRIYVRDERDAAAALSRVRPRCRPGATIEAAISAVCRPELLVEIEAVADL
jgi:chorismate lyase/3-hydroxybenzoate synthase